MQPFKKVPLPFTLLPITVLSLLFFVFQFAAIAQDPENPKSPRAMAAQSKDLDKQLRRDLDAVQSTKNGTAKLLTETWEAYLKRLAEKQFITKQNVTDWNAGKVVVAKHQFLLTHYKSQPEIFVMHVSQTRTELRNGKEVQVRHNKQIRNPYTLFIPSYIEAINGTLTLPIKGQQPDDVKFEGFLNEDNNPVITEVIPPKPRMDDVATPEVQTRKTADENWEEYGRRLVTDGHIDQADFDRWSEGGNLLIEKSFIVFRFRSAPRVAKLAVIESTEGNDDVIEPSLLESERETVRQKYNAKIAYRGRKIMTIDLPPMGSLAGNEEYDGFLPQFTPDNSLSGEEKETALKEITSKDSSEPWDDYISRLHRLRLISHAHIDKLNLGQNVKIQHKYRFTFNRKVNNVNRKQRMMKIGAFAIPGKGNRRPDAENPGFTFRQVRSGEETR